MNKCEEIVNKVFRKLKLNKAIYKIVATFSSEKKECKDYVEARKELNNFYSNKETSVVSNNIIEENPQYDLQIVVPVYNVEKYLDKCLSSIINQKTKYKYCVYIVNDGSTDNSLNIINKYIKENVFIINTGKEGVSKARNKGFNNIMSKYLFFVDADDYIADDCINKLLDYAYENDADIVEGSYISYNSKKSYKFIKDTKSSNGSNLNGFVWNKVFKSTYFEKFIFPENYLYEDTMPSFLIYPLTKRIYTIRDITYYHLINSDGIALSNKGKTNSIDSYWLTELLDKTRAQLNYNTDSEYFELLKKQFVMNYQRTRILPIEIQKDIFILEKQILINNNYEIFRNDELLNHIYEGFFYKYLDYVRWY